MLRSICLAAAFCLLAAHPVAATTVFSTDFDGTLAPEINPGTATLTGVQGYAGLGPAGDQFSGNFLRSIPANIVTLTLSGLPQHDSLSLEFLFAAIDSLDGTGNFPSGDFFVVTVDGVEIFNESFANALLSQIQSYVPPPGVELARHIDLGFSGPGSYYTDSAYNLGADPVFANLAHTASTVTFTFLMQGPGNQALDDESWAIDNLRVITNVVPEPSALALLAAAGLAIGAVRRT